MSLLAKHNPIPFVVWYRENKPELEQEFKAIYRSGDHEISCATCEGSGEEECDLHYDHGCGDCDGTGKITLTYEDDLYDYALNEYQAQVARDRRVVERYDKELCHANS